MPHGQVNAHKITYMPTPRLLTWLFVLGLLVGCASPTAGGPTQIPLPVPTASATPALMPTASLALRNDFEPPTGRDPNAPREAPGAFRLLTATSADGLTYTPTGQAVIDQANVPDLVLGDNGVIHLYYTLSKLGDRSNVLAAALSADFGQTWVFKQLTIEGLAANQPMPVDPDIVRLPDGAYRLYATTNVEGRKLGIVYMDSRDGLNFGPSALALAHTTNVLDSTTFLFNGQWHMFVLDADRPEQWHAVSDDGRAFRVLEKTPFATAGATYFAANGYAMGEAYRLIGFAAPNRDFRAFDSIDGQAWTAQPGQALTFAAAAPLAHDQIKDPTILPLPNGGYLMVFVTRLP